MALFGLDGGLFIPIFSNKYHRSKPKYLYSDTDPPQKKHSQIQIRGLASQGIQGIQVTRCYAKYTAGIQ